VKKIRVGAIELELIELYKEAVRSRRRREKEG